MSGLVSHLKGLAAEDAVARYYEAKGARVLARRWRGKGAEVDLVFGDDQGVVFVEVKTSKTIAQAQKSLGQRQIERLLAAGAEFLGTLPRGEMTPARFDVAAMDGSGRIEVVENALMA